MQQAIVTDVQSLPNLLKEGLKVESTLKNSTMPVINQDKYYYQYGKVDGKLKILTATTCLNFSSMVKKLAHTSRKNKQRANKECSKQQAYFDKHDECLYKVGTLFYAKTLAPLAPFNTKAGTQYLLSEGITVLVERMASGFVCYNTGGATYSSIHHVRTNFAKIKIQRTEFKVLNKDVIFSQKGKGTKVVLTIKNVFKYLN